MTLCNIKTIGEYFDNSDIRPIIDSSLILWITTDNGDSTTCINRVPSNNGIIIGGSRELLHPLIGSGIHLQGSSVLSNINFGNMTVTGGTGITIEVVAKLLSNSGNRTLIEKGVYGGFGTSFSLGFGYLQTIRFGTEQKMSTSYAPTIGTIYHFCGRIDSSELTTANANIFIDGLNFLTSSTRFSIGNNAAPIIIGASPSKSEYANLVVYEARVYTRPLSDSEILTNYQNSVVNYINKNTI